jgi:hypothetical protein
MAQQSDRVQLIGSVPLPDCEAVFRRVASALGGWRRRLETWLYRGLHFR